MDLTVRPIRPDEMDRWVRAVLVPFLVAPRGEEADEAVRLDSAIVDPETAWAVFDGDRIVGNAATLRLSLSLPSAPDGPCPSVPMTAVTAVGVHPTHRRRGLLRRLMAELVADGVARGETVAGLNASEAGIYGRFGFGVATTTATAVLERRRVAFAVPTPEIGVALVEPDEAAASIPLLAERIRARQPGQVSRSPGLWAELFADLPSHRRGRSGNFYALAEEGYAIYRAERGSIPGGGATVQVSALEALDPGAEAALWRYLTSIDLVASVRGRVRVEDPLRHRLADPRAMSVGEVGDWLWLRVLDVPGAFSARQYTAAGRLVLEVVAAPAGTGTGGADPAAGRFVLEAGPDGATCRPARAGEPSELVLGVAELAPLLVGGTPASVLRAAGRLDELSPGAARRADQLFASAPAPYCTTWF
jgi:predicted acetyltransferase